MEDSEELNIDEAEGRIQIKLSKTYYEREAVFAVAHKFSDGFGVKIHPEGDATVVMTLIRNGIPLDSETLKKIANECLNELIDQQLRLDLEKRNGKIRELIVQQAFNPIKAIEDELRKIQK